jgi:hypothetical protein
MKRETQGDILIRETFIDDPTKCVGIIQCHEVGCCPVLAVACLAAIGELTAFRTS